MLAVVDKQNLFAGCNWQTNCCLTAAPDKQNVFAGCYWQTNSLRFAYSHQPIGNRRQNVYKDMLKIIRKSSQIMENPSKIVPKSIPNLWQINENIVLDRLGPEVAVAGRGPAPQMGPGRFASWFLIHFLNQNCWKDSVLGTPEIPKWFQNIIF